MRVIFGVISLLIVLFVVVGLAKNQLGPILAVPIHQQNPALVDQSDTLPVISDGATPQVQNQKIEQQIKQSLEAAMHQARSVPDEAK